MIVKVTKGHIKQGTPDCGNTCPVALALKDAGIEKPWVDPDGWEEDGKVGVYEFSGRVSKFIVDFDNRRDRHFLKPFTFRTRKPRANRRRSKR